MDATTPEATDAAATSPQQEVTGAQPPREQPPKKGKRERKPLTAEQRRKATARQAISRRLEELVTSGDVEAMERAAESLRGGAKASTPAAAPAQASAAPPAAAAAPAPSAPPPPPGWPTKEATKNAMPAAMMAANAVTLAAGIAGVELGKPRELPGFEKPVVFTEMLAESAAPVLALYAPDFLNTPMGGLVCTALMIASVCIAEAIQAKAAEAASAPQKAPEGAGVAAPREVPRA